MKAYAYYDKCVVKVITEDGVLYCTPFEVRNIAKAEEYAKKITPPQYETVYLKSPWRDDNFLNAVKQYELRHDCQFS